jgi:hypothetical protein
MQQKNPLFISTSIENLTPIKAHQMKPLFRLLWIAIPVICSAQGITQNVTGSAEGNDHNATHETSWTIGEVITETHSMETLTLTQGFQQDNLAVSWIGEDIPTEFQINAYPNPAKDIIIIELQKPGLGYQVINAKGRVIQNGIFFSVQDQIDFSDIPSGIYFLKVKDYKTHKIVKR